MVAHWRRAAAWPWRWFWRQDLHWRILLGLVVGAVAGVAARVLLAPEAVQWVTYWVAEPAGQVFLRLIFAVVLMLVFSALVLGIAEIGDVRKLGRVGGLSLAYTLLLSGCSVAIGLALANGIRPGERLAAESRERLKAEYQQKAKQIVAQSEQAQDPRDTVLELIPQNPLQEMVGALDGSSPGGGMLAVMVFALLVGVALTAVDDSAPLLGVFKGLYDVSLVIIGWAMTLAPFGVAGLMFALTAELGVGILLTLGWYAGTVLLGLGLHLVVVYSVVLVVFARRNPWHFARQIKKAMVTAFATSSSSATLPVALRVAEEDAVIRPEVARFVLTIGATANQNGTALYEGITVLFLAQVFGVDLTLGQQVTVVLMSVLAGVGTAGVPGGSLPLIAIVLATVGIPAEGIGIILGVDRLLDMARTIVNVTGDLVIAACADRSAGEMGDTDGEQAGEPPPAAVDE